MDEPAYTYRARFVSAYDGDTITVDLDLGFGVWLHGQRLRLHGIDTPEMRGEERPDGIVARDYVRHALSAAGDNLIVQTLKDEKGKFGRWLAIVWIGDRNLNASLIEKGLADPYLP